MPHYPVWSASDRGPAATIGSGKDGSAACCDERGGASDSSEPASGCNIRRDEEPARCIEDPKGAVAAWQSLHYVDNGNPIL